VNKRLLAAAVLAFVAFAAGALWAQQTPLAPAEAQQGTTVVPMDGAAAGVKNPVVACTPLTYTTENDEDPFNPERIRRTRTTVTTIVVVRADGTTEVKKPGGG